jgi:calcineurin-like phosphoesterase family protein
VRTPNETIWKRFCPDNKITSSKLVMCHYPVREMSDEEMERRFIERQREEASNAQVNKMVGSVQR